MNYIIFDTEYNQSGDLGKLHILGNKECPNEIIEIGAVKLDEELNIIDTFRIFIKPTISNIIHPKVLRKTKITLDDLAYGFKFPIAYSHFKKWCEDDIILCSWSDNDIVETIKNCNFHKLDFDISDKYLDIQKLYMNIYNLKNLKGLKKAIEEQEIETDNRLHRALDDSLYTSEVFKKVFNKELVQKTIINVNEVDIKQDKYITDPNSDKIAKNKLYIKCPRCKRFAKRNTQWIEGKNGNLWALGECANCNIFISVNTFILEKYNGEIEYDSKSMEMLRSNYYKMFKGVFGNISG